MRKALRILCFALGTALLAAALFLVLHNTKEAQESGEAAQNILGTLKEQIPEYTEPVETVLTGELDQQFAETQTETVSAEMPSFEIDGHEYIGYISLPDLGLELPVLREWSYPNLKIAPCCYSGSLLTNDLIICAHNYVTHFGRIRRLKLDSEIWFTDAAGRQYRFIVWNIEELPGTAVEQMQFGDADNWDLTLFTCTLGGKSRVTVRAVLAEE